MFVSLNKDRMLRDFSNAKQIDLISTWHNDNEGACKHLYRGLLERVNMMEEAIVEWHMDLQDANKCPFAQPPCLKANAAN